jgi:hypothetical protein
MSGLLILPNGRFPGALGAVDLRWQPILRMVPTRFSGLERQLAANPASFTLIASLAAFGAYTAMQAFRTPFLGATCSRQEIGGVSLKCCSWWPSRRVSRCRNSPGSRCSAKPATDGRLISERQKANFHQFLEKPACLLRANRHRLRRRPSLVWRHFRLRNNSQHVNLTANLRCQPQRRSRWAMESSEGQPYLAPIKSPRR